MNNRQVNDGHASIFFLCLEVFECMLDETISKQWTYICIHLFRHYCSCQIFSSSSDCGRKKNEILGKFLKWNRYKFRFSMVVFPLSFIFCCVCVCFACCFCFLFCLYSDLNFIALIFIHSVFRFFLSVWLMYAFTEYDVGIV